MHDLLRPFTNLANRSPIQMALEMRKDCENCHTQLSHMSEAFICSYECTFCPDCARSMNAVCPNCGGQLTRRPTRQPN